jgi:hypothetical protein
VGLGQMEDQRLEGQIIVTSDHAAFGFDQPLVFRKVRKCAPNVTGAFDLLLSKAF